MKWLNDWSDWIFRTDCTPTNRTDLIFALFLANFFLIPEAFCSGFLRRQLTWDEASAEGEGRGSDFRETGLRDKKAGKQERE